MTDATTWQAQLEDLGEDVKAEVVYYLLDGKNVSQRLMLFYLNGGFKRIFRYDVEQIHGPGHRKYKTKARVIEINRKGLYDQFPEHMFHYSKTNKPFKNIAELKGEHEHHLKLQEDARRFFWPLDDQFVRLKSYILSFELRMGQYGSFAGKDYLRRFWGIPDFFDTSQSRLLTSVLPMAREISANIAWMQQVFEAVLHAKVSIKKELCAVIRTNHLTPIYLNKSRLGVDTVIGSTFEDVRYRLRISIGPLSMDLANGFAINGPRSRECNYLCEHLLPIDMEVKVEVIPNSDFSFILKEGGEVCSILGLSSILSN